MQMMTEAVEDKSKKIGLYVNVGKCKTMVSNNQRDDTEIKVGGTAGKVFDDFCYLGSFVSSNSSCDKDC